MHPHISDELNRYYQRNSLADSVSEIVNLSKMSRRSFIKAAGLGTTGLLLGISLPTQAKNKSSTAFSPSGFIHLNNNGDLTLYCGRCEMGQGISTALPSAVADEMDADWSRVTVKQGEGNEQKYGPQDTGGSASIRVMYEPMRKAGAAAKQMLMLAAAKVWAIDVTNVTTNNHYVINKSTGQKLNYGDLVDIAKNIEVPDNPTLKSKESFRYIGTDLPRHDQQMVVVGQRTYGADTIVEGMKFAAISHCPVLGGKLKSVDKSDAVKVKGVIDVVEIAPIEHPFSSVGAVAVVADNSWTAQQALKKLRIEWDLGANKEYNTKQYRASLIKRVEQDAQEVFSRGDVDRALDNAAKIVSATYSGGHLCHAPMEPNASVVSVTDDRCQVWASTQSPKDIQNVLAKLLDRQADDIEVNVMISGGAFGRKFKCDYVHEAAVISKQIKAPVKLIWSREEDMRTGFYHSINAQHLKASINEQGEVDGLLQRVAFPSISSLFQAGLDRAPKRAFNDVNNHPFNIANFRSESGLAPAHTRIGWYRAVYAIFYGFAFGSFADELAVASGKDTVSMLHQLFDANKDPKFAEQVQRSKGVLDLAAKQANWGKALPQGEGLGIAVHYSFQSYVAMAVHVKVDGDNIRVLNVDCAIDCGQILNTDGATAQMEGAVVMGMSLALYTEINFENGAVTNSNFHDYPVLRINEMPNVNVHIVDSDASPTGLGEPGVAPFAPALANAIYAATGKRHRHLPIKPMSA
ncbi:molybdopterin-dependent oxidoreductase [Thalassotalea ponticola]|uniref:xanthine dehydrogenase family protein molybdopterin-binding subunit n=1 Tax=Thalassotalea ponticola TaxID=1523392 RepID=UPI0025B560CF|nr:molybdopterin cofactor-binding domain-containing protein [Thalassotalea ponticola]MDN3651457.1 molybdopterin-dependent oxidoreductase [Thalassotalea ponticola]